MLNLVRIRSCLRAALEGRRLAVGVLAALVTIAGAVTVNIARKSPVQRWFDFGHAKQDAAELAQIGAAMKEYSGEHKDLWPGAVSSPYLALPELSAIESNLLTHPDGARLIERVTGRLGPRLCYLGYLTMNNVAGQAVLNHWRKPDASENRWKDIALDAPIETGAGPQNAVFRLKEGIERFLITDICNPAGSSKAQGEIPVLWEMPTAKRPGGLVMYMDLHVEWMPYPGDFPMSPPFIERLQRLAKGEPDVVSASPVRGIADRVVGIFDRFSGFSTTSRGWWVDECDDAPSVRAGEATGYRIVLRRASEFSRSRILRYIPPSESVPCEIVLFPLDGPAPERGAIGWKTTSRCDAGDLIYAGDCHHYRWFTRANIDLQHELRKRILVGAGDNHGKFYLNRAAEQKTVSERAKALLLAAREGETTTVTERIEKELVSASGAPRRDLIRVLGEVHGEHSTRVLASLYRNKQADDAGSAAAALLKPPYRTGIRDIYLDLVNSTEPLPEAFEAAAQMVGDEALPVIRTACYSPRTAQEYRHAYVGKRLLEGAPVAPEIAEAAEIVGRLDSRTGADEITADARHKAINTLISSSDLEAVTTYLTAHVTRYPEPDERRYARTDPGIPRHGVARGCLVQLPKAERDQTLKAIADRVKDRTQAQAIREIMSKPYQ